MKNETTISVDQKRFCGLCPVGWTVVVTRKDVEDALKRLNEPEFAVGDIVTYEGHAYVISDFPDVVQSGSWPIAVVAHITGRGVTMTINIRSLNRVGRLSDFEGKDQCSQGTPASPYDHDDAEAQGPIPAGKRRGDGSGR